MSVDTSGGHPDMDYEEHTKTYAGFVKGTVISVVLVALTLVIMALTLV